MIIIIDYGMGNLKSVYNAFRKFDSSVTISDDPAKIHEARGLVLPGVGAFSRGMQNIRELDLVQVLEGVPERGIPLLGICLGLQLFFSTSEEHGENQGLGLLEGKVVRFRSNDLKIPHMGWNTVSLTQTGSPLFAGIDDSSFFYFAHSFHVEPSSPEVSAGVTEYGNRFVSAVRKNRIFGTQFHPEKSGSAGLKIISNFRDIVFES